MPRPATWPVLVEVTRGDTTESRHCGAVAVVDAAGRLVHSIGDAEMVVFPRSALKPIQALPLLETGAAEAFAISREKIALSCSSHRGEPLHTNKVAYWLSELGLSESDLECGIRAPLDEASQRALVSAGISPSRLHNNCSGQHAGFLCIARHLKAPTCNYVKPEHPVQQLVTRTIAQMTDLDLGRFPRSLDGCGIPAFAVPLRNLALGMARMADPSGLSPSRQSAIKQVMAAMAAAPRFVDGTKGMVSAVLTTTRGAIKVKPGAEGVYCAMLPELGLGIALKIIDGASRASEFAMLSILERMNCFSPEQRESLENFFSRPVCTADGRIVGRLQPTEDLLALGDAR